MKLIFILNFLLIVLPGCAKENNNTEMYKVNSSDDNYLRNFSGETEKATFAGGCFWCIEQPFEGIDGVISVTSGYAGGKEENPTYEEVSSGKTGYRESVQILFDPQVISYSELLSVYWKQFDPTDKGGSFHDRGKQYTSAIFYHNDEQKEIAEKTKKQLDKSGIFDMPVITPIIEFTTFYPAEEYHQDYYMKNPENYHRYKKASGREDFIKETWGEIKTDKYNEPSPKELKSKLTDLQYKVTQQNGTERAFRNEYWDNHKKGIYVDVVTGEPLFTSTDKFESGTGWPSFTRPIDPRLVEKLIDSSHSMKRVEVRSSSGDNHLGHLFDDGIEPTGIRYCMNSAALKFVPVEKMKEEGYSRYIWLID